MNKVFFVILILCSTIYGCKTEKRLAIDTIEKLEYYMKNKQVDRVSEIYPTVVNLVYSDCYKTDAYIVKEVEKLGNKRFAIYVESQFENVFGKKYTQNMTLYLCPSEDGKKYIIYDSYKFVDYRDANKYYDIARKTGCLYEKVDITDQEIAKKMEMAKAIFSYLCLKVRQEWEKQIIIKTWSWRTSYYGNTARGKGICVNNSDFPISKPKYKITYIDRQGNVLTTDNGYISYDVIYPGHSQAFTFYSGYIGNASKASIEMLFDEEKIEECVLTQNYTGTEYIEYLEFQDMLADSFIEFAKKEKDKR